MTAPDAELPAFSEPASPSALGGGFMVICQVVLGLVLLLLWQGASGRQTLLRRQAARGQAR